MAIAAITSAFANYAQKVTGTSSGGVGGGTSSALQEATETAAQTAQEARNGDRVAIKKLLQIQQQSQSGASQPGQGEIVDHKA